MIQQTTIQNKSALTLGEVEAAANAILTLVKASVRKTKSKHKQLEITIDGSRKKDGRGFSTTAVMEMCGSNQVGREDLFAVLSRALKRENITLPSPHMTGAVRLAS